MNEFARIIARGLRQAGLAILTALSAAGCSDASSAPAPSSEVAVDRFASPNPGSVNAYWVRTSGGVVLVDTGRNQTGGDTIANSVAALGAPVVAIVLTHPHPDHVGGLGKLRARFPDAPVYASRGTDRVMREDPLGFYPLARMADPDYPAKIDYATQVFDDGATLEVGSLRLETRGYADAESIATTVYRDAATGLLFVGDLLAEGVTPALIEGHSCGWLERLAALRVDYAGAGTAYPGHGDSGPFLRQLDATVDYLRKLRALVRGAIAPASDGGDALTNAEKTALAAQLDAAYPNHPPVASLPNLVAVNLDAVAGELRKENASTLPEACR